VKAGIICLRTLGFDKDEQEMATAFLCLEILFPQKFETPRNDWSANTQKALFRFLTVTKFEGTFVRNVTMEHEIDGVTVRIVVCY
jgi:hypothetical protein